MNVHYRASVKGVRWKEVRRGVRPLSICRHILRTKFWLFPLPAINKSFRLCLPRENGANIWRSVWHWHNAKCLHR